MEISSFAEGEYDHIFKVIILGDKKCGKTSLLRAFCYKSFTKNVKTTVGIDFHVSDITIVHQNKPLKVRLQLWDTSGEEKYRSISSVYYRNAEGVILLFDVTDKQTFENVPMWLGAVRKHCVEAPLVLIANKCDLEESVSYTEVTKLANDEGLKWLKTSAKEDTNVDQLFQQLAVQLVARRVEHVDASYAFVPASVVLTHRGRGGKRMDAGHDSDLVGDVRSLPVGGRNDKPYGEGYCCHV